MFRRGIQWATTRAGVAKAARAPVQSWSILLAVPTTATTLSTPLRFCSSSSSSSNNMTAASPSAVNVEEFTLNDDVVRRDLEVLSRWNALSERMDAARAAADHDSLLAAVKDGLALLEEVGPLNAPVQCESLLCLEGSQAHFNLGQHAEALTYAERAKASLMDCKPEQRDNAQIAEINQFKGYILAEQGKAAEALEVFNEVLHWIDVDAKSAMPMQAVAAVNLRRTVVTGVGRCTLQLAVEKDKQGATAEAKELYAKALDTLIDSLNKHIDENDFEMVKTTLKSILDCFEGLSDVEQAITTCRKYVSWCDRHGDAEGVKQGKDLLDDICTRNNRENPLKAEEK